MGREKCRRRCRISNNLSRSGCSKPSCIRAPRSVGNGPNMLALPRRTPASQDQVRTWQQADASDDIRNSERLVRAVVITAIGGDPHDKRLAPAWYWHRGRGSPPECIAPSRTRRTRWSEQSIATERCRSSDGCPQHELARPTDWRDIRRQSSTTTSVRDACRFRLSQDEQRETIPMNLTVFAPESSSTGEQRDDVTRSRERSNLESGTF